MAKIIKVGVVGLGRAGRFMHIPELQQFPEHFKVVAAADWAEERRNDLPESMKDLRIYASLEEMLTDPEIEMVTIATRSQYHTKQAIQALEAGKYAVVDKPIAVSVAEAEALVAASKRHPGKLFLRFNRRFEPIFNQVRGIIAEGILGNVSMVKLYRHTGFVRRKDWQTLTEFSGGMLNNWGPHLIDQALLLLESPVADLWCDLRHILAAGDAEDQIKLLLRAESGRVADIEISSCVALSANWYEVWGDRGALTVPADGAEVKLRYLDPAQKLPPLAAVRGLFPLAYGNPEETLRFIEESRPVARSKGHTFQRGKMVDPRTAKQSAGYTYDDTMWNHVYDAITAGAGYPIRVEDGLAVTKVIDEARRKSGYLPHELDRDKEN